MTKKTDESISIQFLLTAALVGEAGFPEEQASHIAQQVLNGFNKAGVGGERLYVPCVVVDRRARDASIRAEFNGRNHDDLARKWDISRTSVYRIVAQAA